VTLVYTDPIFQQHDTGRHPETSRRLASIGQRLDATGLLSDCPRGALRAATTTELQSVHAPGQIELVAELAGEGGGAIDPDTPVSARSYEVALQAVGAATSAVDAVMSGKHRNALCLVRPPGHHATQTGIRGFCCFKNVAVAARHAEAAHGVSRILIVDWDVHHGNGTQHIFYDVENVVFYSIHRHPFYPGTGKEHETGMGKGLGATINVPVAFGTDRKTYLSMFERGLERAAAQAKPELILLSAGFDAHAADPIGSLGLASEDFATMTRSLKQVADTYCKGRIVSCLEGGYDLDALGESVAAHLTELKA